MAHGSETNELPVKRFESMPGRVAIAIPVLVSIGLLVFVAGLFVDSQRAWRAYLFNWLFFSGIAMGGVMLAVVVTMTRGLWSRPIRRIALSMVAFLPISFILMLPMFFAAGQIFPWLHEPVTPGKEAYLNVPFLVIRQMLALGALYTLAFVFAYWSLRPDVGLLRGQAGRLSGLYERLSRDWQGQEQEEARAHRKIAVLGPIIALTYALAFSLVSWDFIMSLEPHWFSTLIGPYFFMGAFLGGVALTAILTTVYTRVLDVEEFVSPTQFHDLGKLTFAFTVFWGYLLFSQFIVIWYGLLPGEQSFVAHRFAAPFNGLARLVFLLLFVMPFFGLLGVAPKRRPEILSMFAGVSLLGLWLERFLLVYPSFYAGADRLPLGWLEIGVAPLFGGLLLFALTAFATRFPMFQLWQPMTEVELGGLQIETSKGEI